MLQWLIGAGIVVVVGWVILQPQRWGRRDNGNGTDGGFYAEGTHRRDGDDNDGDGDGGD